MLLIPLFLLHHVIVGSELKMAWEWQSARAQILEEWNYKAMQVNFSRENH